MRTDGWINIEKKKELNVLDITQDQLSETSESTISTIPPSLFSTPRTIDDFLPNVDLTLSSNVKKSDIKTHLVEIFSQCKYEQGFRL